jgi:hypothetical protein
VREGKGEEKGGGWVRKVEEHWRTVKKSEEE